MGDEALKKQPNVIQHFEKSPDYKTIYASGIYGGGTMHGLLSVNIITDIPALPITTESEVKGNQLVQVKADFAGKSHIREIQCNLLLNLDTAKLLKQWLETNVKLLEDAITQSKK